MILFSPVGFTDPVCGLRDGPLLHILRHYRPEKIFLIYSREVGETEEKKNLLSFTLKSLKEKWHYTPEIILASINTTNPSILSEVAGPLHQALKNFSDQNPNEEVIVNLSSGTPTMQTVLMMEVLNGDYLGLQVSNPDKKASERIIRTNVDEYDVEVELAFNMDDEEQEDLTIIPKDNGRCSPSRLGYIQLNNQLENIKGLLTNYNYQALTTMDLLPKEIRQLAEHLDNRMKLNEVNARKISKSLKLPFNLYPEKSSSLLKGKELEEARRTIEYYLALKILKNTKQYSDFLLRLNPLITNLQMKIISDIFKKEDFMGQVFKNKPNRNGVFLLRKDLENFNPKLLDYLDNRYMKQYKDNSKKYQENFFSIDLGNKILDFYVQEKKLSQKITEFFQEMSKLNSLRNAAAHSLTLYDEDIIIKNNKFTPIQIEKELENLIRRQYPIATPDWLNLYDNSNAYILEYLESILE